MPLCRQPLWSRVRAAETCSRSPTLGRDVVAELRSQWPIRHATQRVYPSTWASRSPVADASLIYQRLLDTTRYRDMTDHCYLNVRTGHTVASGTRMTIASLTMCLCSAKNISPTPAAPAPTRQLIAASRETLCAPSQ